MRVLVTGASGFVGSTLCDELVRQGHDISVLVRKTSKLGNLPEGKVKQVIGDLRDGPSNLQSAVRGAEVIFHVAGVISAVSREDYFAANMVGTRNLAEAAVREKGSLQRFVLVSSLAAAGPAERGGQRLENDLSQPISHYGESKLAGEEVVRGFGDRLPSVILRPPVVYGPRDRGVFSFFKAASRGILPLLGLRRPDPRRYSFVHVEDLVRGIVSAGFTKTALEPAEIFYLTGDGEYSWEEAMRTIAEALGKRAFPMPIPLPALGAAAGLCTLLGKTTGKVPPLTLDKMKEIKAYTWTCSNEKAKAKLGFKPYLDFARGVHQTARWYLEHGWL